MAILDQGYQHWKGHVAGHGWRWLAITRNGIRVNMRSMWVRILIILSWLPALALAGVVCIWGLAEQKTSWAVGFFQSMGMHEVASDPASFRLTAWRLIFHFFFHVEMFFSMILVMTIGPGLISRDLRFNALPLYFSRPIRRIDYFLGKLGTIAFFLFLVTVVPSIIAWVFGVLFSLNFRVAIDTVPILFAVVAYGLIVSLSAGLLMLALSALTRKSGYVVMMWFGLWIAGGLTTQILEGVLFFPHMMRDGPRMQRWQQRMNEAHRIQGGPRGVNFPMDPVAGEEVDDQRAERRKRFEEEESRDWDEMKADVNALKEAWREDWRLLPSFTQNLLRIGDALLGTYEAKDRYFAQMEKRVEGGRRFGGPNQPRQGEWSEPPMMQMHMQGLEPRWPWYWSAGVLLVLAALSIWILHTRVRSLDRLK